jgi:Tfp pilus assembly protein PilF/predicted nucleic acid-binding Zn ribbon protein
MASENSVVCKVCGATNPKGTKTCTSCGIALVAPLPKSSAEVDDLLKGMLESEQSRVDAKQEDNIDDLLDSLVLASEESFDCPMCGTAVPPGSQSCPSCGSEFVEKQIEPEKGAEELFALNLENELDKLSDELERTEASAPESVPHQQAIRKSVSAPAPKIQMPEPVPDDETDTSEPEPEIAPERHSKRDYAEVKTTARDRGAAFAEPEAAIELDTADGDLPSVHIIGSRYVDGVVLTTISAMVVAFAVTGMYKWSNLSAFNVAILVGIALGGIIASFMLFRISVSAVAEGDRLLKDGKYRESLDYYERAIHIDSKPSAAWTSKGVALKRLEMYGDALRAHNMALKLNPRNEIALCNRGDLMFRVGRVEDALENYNDALKIRPGYAVAWNNKAIALASRGDLGEAKLCEDEAIRLKPKYATAWVNKGRILVQLGKREEAVRCLQKARSLAASNA